MDEHCSELKPGMVEYPRTLDQVRHNAQIDANAEQRAMAIYERRGSLFYEERGAPLGMDLWPRTLIEVVEPEVASSGRAALRSQGEGAADPERRGDGAP